MIGYKFLRTGLKSNYDGSKWKIGEWRKEDPPTQECEGLNCSKLIFDALRDVEGEILAKVEYGGKVIHGGDKETCEKMRIIKAWKWAKKESVKLAIFSARLVLSGFEKKYPNDDRPRKAIEAAETWVKNPTAKNRAAAYAAADAAAYAAAYADYAAVYAAADAAYAAYAAAYAARAAARADYAAAYAAADAAYAAADAARAAADAARAKKKIHKYALSLIPGMKEVR